MIKSIIFLNSSVRKNSYGGSNYERVKEIRKEANIAICYYFIQMMSVACWWGIASNRHQGKKEGRKEEMNE